MGQGAIIRIPVDAELLHTQEELNAFINASAENAISYACYRNPITMYQYIKQNYPIGSFPNFKAGLETTKPSINSMHNFLMNAYNALPDNKKAHYLYTILHSLPKQPQLINWTTPKTN
ncbi:MAG: hypothetical protein EBX41_01970 [Chitinophagia bacterium]|nr:hypothetical protein [Chitinophagia bacterium]